MKKRLIDLLVFAMIVSLLAGLAVTAYAADGEEPDDEKTEESAPSGEESEEADEEEAKEDYEGLARIGVESDGGYKIKLINATGSDIQGLNIQSTTEDTWVWSDEMLAEGDLFENGETSLLCYTPREGETEETLYNFQVVFTDWTVGYLHNVYLSDMDEAELNRAPITCLPYLIYTSLAAKEEINTSEAEQKAFEGELASGFWDSVINAGSSSSSGGGSSSGGSSSGGGGYSGGGSSSGGSGGGCITDGLLW